MSAEQNLLIYVQQAALRFPIELSTILGVTVEQLESAVKTRSTQSNNQLIGKLTKAMHLNEKLSDSAMGADATMHQYIDDELKSVIHFIK